MKYIALIVFLFSALVINAQETPAFDGHKWKAPYHLPIPEKWSIERFLIPISFAPQILYKGVEDIRFAPGWANKNSEEYWAYAFLWYLDDSIKTDAKIIADNLKAYYTGLIIANTDPDKIGGEKSIPVTTTFKIIETADGDLKTFSGTVEMLDYMQRKPLTLNVMVHLKYCTMEKKTLLFYKLSPQPFAHNSWLSINKLWLDFKCNKD